MRNRHLHQRLDKKFSFDGIMGKSHALEGCDGQSKTRWSFQSYRLTDW